MASSEERPIKIYHTWVGEERVMESSVDGVLIDKVFEVPKDLDVPVVYLLGMLLHFTTKEGAAISHPAFGEEAA